MTPSFENREALLRWAEREVSSRRGALWNDVALCMLPAHEQLGPTISAMGLGVAVFAGAITCCACLESLTAFQTGKAGASGPTASDIAGFAKEFCEYDEWKTLVLIKVYRHKLAHLFAPGASVRCEIPNNKGGTRTARVSWGIATNDPERHLQLFPNEGGPHKTGQLPWEMWLDAVLTICLKSFQTDLITAADKYLDRLKTDLPLQKNFERAMQLMYPST